MEYMIRDILLESYHLIWTMYENGFDVIPDEEWAKGDIGYLIPSRLYYHAIEAADFYNSNSRDFDWGYYGGVDPEEATQKTLPSKEKMREYHIMVKKNITDTLSSMSDADLMAEETVFKWTGSIILSRYLYLLSHYRQHIGEVNAELRRRGLERIKWVTF